MLKWVVLGSDGRAVAVEEKIERKYSVSVDWTWSSVDNVFGCGSFWLPPYWFIEPSSIPAETNF